MTLDTPAASEYIEVVSGKRKEIKQMGSSSQGTAATDGRGPRWECTGLRSCGVITYATRTGLSVWACPVCGSLARSLDVDEAHEAGLRWQAHLDDVRRARRMPASITCEHGTASGPGGSL
jgi:hypothetical protein